MYNTFDPLTGTRLEAEQYLLTATREGLIELLKGNDPNGVYTDAASIKEFGRPSTLDELKDAFANNWDGIEINTPAENVTTSSAYLAIQQQMVHLEIAMKEISENWLEVTEKEREILESNYPFQWCMDELSIDVKKWVEQNTNQ